MRYEAEAYCPAGMTANWIGLRPASSGRLLLLKNFDVPKNSKGKFADHPFPLNQVPIPLPRISTFPVAFSASVSVECPDPLMLFPIALNCHTKNYQPLASELSQTIGPQPGCIKRRNVGDTQRAALDYFANIRTLPYDSEEDCRLLLTYTAGGVASRSVPPEWHVMWERRLGGGRKAETFKLYRRD